MASVEPPHIDWEAELRRVGVPEEAIPDLMAYCESRGAELRERWLRSKHRVTCPSCGGRGYTARSVVHPSNPMMDTWAHDFCTTCKGSGEVPTPSDRSTPDDARHRQP